MAKRIGVLALQGDVERHLAALGACGALAVPVKREADLGGLDGLILPGGESTTIGKLLDRFGLFPRLEKLIQADFPVYGTCAGLILLAREISGRAQPAFGALDIAVSRNAYGPQVESFEAEVDIPVLGPEPFRAVFIRAPIITRTGPGVEVLARFEERPVLIRQGRILASSFHPELTDDRRVHRHFVSLI